MSNKPVHNPHDRFFKQTLGRVEVARGFLRKFLAPSVIKCLDLESLSATKDSFIDDDLKQTFSDLVYTVRRADGGEVVVYLLFEHKSHPDPLTAFQSLKYVVRIGEQRIRDGFPLCCVIPIVIYHGPVPWNVARTVHDSIDVPEPLSRFVPTMNVELLDLSGYSDEQLRAEAFLQATLLLLKYIFRPELPVRLTGIFGLLSDLEGTEGLESIKLVLRYVASGSDRVTADELSNALQRGLQSKGESIMPTIADQWVQQGHEKGREEGREEGVLIGEVRVYQELIGLSVTPVSELAKLEANELETILADLKARFKH